ncbi:MAG TPA: DUF58 domain-containing protein [Thermotogaceae bacterium]|nr:DUF58 domain-containing protein [Thermotogaceae bacterium]
MLLETKSIVSTYRPLVWLSIVGIVWLVIQLDAFSVFFGSIIGIFWLEFYIVKRILLNLKVERFLEKDRVFIDQELRISYTIESDSLNYLIVEFRPSFYGNTVLSKFSTKKLKLVGGKKIKVDFDVSFATRGLKDVSGCVFFYVDPLGLFKHWVKYERRKEILVLPNVMDIEEFPARLRELLPGSLSDFKLLEDSTRIRGMREYNLEPLNKIHWKMSAKMGKLYIKEFDYTARANIKLYVDLNLSKEIHAKNVWSQIRKFYQEDVIRLACALVYHSHLKGNTIDLTIIGNEILRMKNSTDWVRSIELLALAQGSDNGPQLNEIVKKDLEKLTPSSTLVIFSMFLTHSILPTFVEAKAKCSRVLVILMPYGFRDPRYKPTKDYSLYPEDMEKLRERALLLEDEQVIVRIIRANQSFQEVLGEIERS